MGEPRRASFHGTAIWVQSRSDLGAGSPFVTDGDAAPFLPDDALRIVQLEEYVPKDGAAARRTAVLKAIYYLLKPMMPRSVQLEAQRANARSRLKAIDFPGWPHDDSLHRLLTDGLHVMMEAAGVERVPFLGHWPKGYRWAACFTHDVEKTPGLRAMESMASIEEDNGIRSTWYIVPERYPVSSSDFAGLRAQDHEIGVHGLNHDGRLFATREEFQRRLPRIQRYIEEWGAVGFRSPALYRNPEWITEFDIRYDSSFMDTAVLEPQDGGVSMIHPYRLDDRVVELPITMPMDHHLINLLRTDVVEGMLDKFHWVVERGGLANFLFHPDYNLERKQMDDYRTVVESVCGTGGGWVATAAEIADWWHRRDGSQLLEDDGRPRIDGPASKDGAIWYAVLDGAELRIDH